MKNPLRYLLLLFILFTFFSFVTNTASASTECTGDQGGMGFCQSAGLSCPHDLEGSTDCTVDNEVCCITVPAPATSCTGDDGGTGFCQSAGISCPHDLEGSSDCTASGEVCCVLVPYINPDDASIFGEATEEQATEPLEYVLMETTVSPNVDPNNAEVCNYLGGVFILLIGLVGVLSVLFIFISGIELILGGANPGAKSDAKDRLWGSVIGLLISLVAWLLLNSINPVLRAGCFDAPANVILDSAAYVAPTNQQGPIINIEPVNLCLPIGGTYEPLLGVEALDPEQGNITADLDIYGDEFTTNLPEGSTLVAYVKYYVEDADGNSAEGTRIVYIGYDCDAFEENVPVVIDPSEPFDGICNRTALVEAEFSAGEIAVRNALAAADIGINKGACPDLSCSYKVVTGGCTSVEALPNEGIAALKTFADECPNCGTIIVTGGTEAGHLTHGPGNPIVDITMGNSALNLYVKNTAVSTGTTSNGKWIYYIVPVGSGTAYFMNEKHHWHVVF